MSHSKTNPVSCEDCLYYANCISYFKYCIFTGKKALWTESERLKMDIETFEIRKYHLEKLNSLKREVQLNDSLTKSDKLKRNNKIDDLIRKSKKNYGDNSPYKNPHSCDICGFYADCEEDFVHCPYFSGKKSLKTKKSLGKKDNPIPQHRCKICKKSLPSSNTYCAFCMTYEMESSICRICGENFSDFKGYEEHLLAHPKCEYCGEMCKSKSALKEHIKKEHYECEYCKKIFKSEQERRSHVRSVHQCKVCGNYYKLLASHMKKHPYCDVCKKYILSKEDYNKQHLELHPTCKYCGEQQVSEIELNAHIENHKCPICSDYFPLLDEHLKSHPKCELCGKLVFDDTKLAEHLRDDHQCDICGEHFVDKNELNKHRETHFKLKCSVCGMKFITESDLKEHLKTHIKCSFCSKYFKGEVDLAKHLNENHPTCELCGTRFPTKSMLKKHKHKK